MKIHQLSARDLPDLWFQAVHDILDHGRRFVIDRGSYAGQTRLEYDFTAMGYACAFQVVSLFLFIYTADDLAPLFEGAMCAAGTLYASAYGYPTLLLKAASTVLAGSWLIVNHADNRAYDYPLIRKKYAMLLGLTPLIALEAVLQFLYFQGLRPDVITSCCGSLFSVNSPSVAADLPALPAAPMKVVFAVTMAATILPGIRVAARGRGGYLFSGAAAASFLVGSASVLSFLSIAVYELPTHHCPFCFLQKEYGYIGYLVVARGSRSLRRARSR